MTRPNTETAGPSRPSPEDWVSEHADALFRYARSRVPGEHEAKDIVQETLVAGWKSCDRKPAGETELLPWLKGILRHKIADHYRKVYRERGAAEPMERGDDYERSGHWDDVRSPKSWREPSESDTRGRYEVREVLDFCLGKIPPSHARLFLLREAECLETPQIMEVTGMSESNVFVMLHRARLALRRCLEENHFSAKGAVR